MILKPFRTEALSAVALVVSQGRPVAAGLAALAADDVLLRPWAKRLSAARTKDPGASLGKLLRGAGLLRRNEAVQLDRAAGTGRIQAELEHLAGTRRGRPPGLALVKLWPVWLMVACLAGVLGANLLGNLAGFMMIYEEIGLELPSITRILFATSPLTILAVAGITTGAAWLTLAGPTWEVAGLPFSPWWPRGLHLQRLGRDLRALLAADDGVVPERLSGCGLEDPDKAAALLDETETELRIYLARRRPVILASLAAAFGSTYLLTTWALFLPLVWIT